VGSLSIEGWAQNTEYPEAPICLDILVGGSLIGQTLANRFRVASDSAATETDRPT
jgi:hypothetical protein